MQIPYKMEQGITKNLIYFIWWNPANGMLKYNLDLLEKYIHLFDGQVLIKAADANIKDLPAFLKHAEIVKNDLVFNEAAHFVNSLNQLKPDSSHTFYAHAKGVSRPVNNALKNWVKAMYKHNLEDIPVLKDKMFSGCFGKLYKPQKYVPHNWHYSGSFYWFKNEILSNPIPEINSRYFTECFPAMMCEMNEVDFKFYASKKPYSVYSDQFWNKNPHLIELL